MAKLDKADRAFCFTSGMAALAAVAHLVESGASSFLFGVITLSWIANLGIKDSVIDYEYFNKLVIFSVKQCSLLLLDGMHKF